MTTPSSNHERGVLDTSTVIILPQIEDPASLLRSQAHAQQAEADFDPPPFDVAAARAFGGVAASLRRGGRKSSACAYDAMIAVTATGTIVV